VNYRRLYLDTAPLYALLESRDQAHNQAFEAFKQATEAGLAILCPYPAALELHRLLVSRKPSLPERAHRSLAAVLSRYSAVMPQEADLQAAIATLRRYPDQKITLADATIAAMASREGAAVLTFDRRHFRLMGVVVYA
jgi:predicted nucleic acid-binding protein